jgi:hypothetical protein
MGRPPADPWRIAPTALAVALAAGYLIWQPPSLDLAAADYRAWLFGHAGWAVWDDGWYGGHHLPGYSVLFPPLGWWLGTRLAGALAVVVAALLFERLAWVRYGGRARVGALWFAAGVATTLFSGRLTFVLGLVFALGALVALQRGSPDVAAGGSWRRGEVSARSVAFAGGAAETSPRRHPPDRALRSTLALGIALLLALLTPLASPVAALFLALAGVAYALAARRTVGLVLAAAALLPIVAFAVAFPEGGTEPFVFSSFWPTLAFAVAALALLPRDERTLRIGVALYALACVAAYVLATPVGGNVVRLGALCGGPVLALALWRRRTLALALVALPLVWWQWSAAIDDVRTASGDPSVGAAYYAPLLAAIAREVGPPGRIEIPFTRLHWEARWVAPRVPLARGWERQLDRRDNALFYGGALTSPRYRAWLDQLAVRWVALPDVRLDYSARQEARLIERGLPYLHEVWRGAHWRLFAVADPAPLANPPARVTRLGTDTVTLAVPRPASIALRIRWTPYWAVTHGDACVSPAGEWTRLTVRRPGTIRLATRFSLTRIRSHAPRCRGR